jgi:hypothetical protein
MSEAEGLGLGDSGRPVENTGEAHRRAAGSPPSGRALACSPAAPAPQPSSLQRVAGALRMALHLGQRLLPPPYDNIASTVSNLLNPPPHTPPPPPLVNLVALDDGLAELQTQYLNLRNLIVVQNFSLKRVENQLELLREATDHNTLEHQKLLEDLKTVGNKINVFALFALALLAVSILLNVFWYLHILRLLP